MNTDIILCGVGGQGILSIASIIGKAALMDNLYMKQAEVHGMSQRGGDVQSNLRISDKPVSSDLIGKGKADIILSLEPMESLRYLPYLKENGWVVTSSSPFKNIPNYPDEEKIFAEIRNIPNHVIIDVEKTAKDLGSSRVANIVLLGAAAPYIGIDIKNIEAGIRLLFEKKGDEIVNLNLKALHTGYEIGMKR